MIKFKENLINKIEAKSARIGIIGLGYVGLPLMLRFAEEGYTVLGFDINEDVVTNINKGNSFIEHISSKSIQTVLERGLVEATSTMSRVNECDAIIMCVPTPLKNREEPDLSYITNTLDSILPNLIAGQIISLESTTYPGTTEEEIVTRLESRNFKIGKDYFVVYSPEREDPGNINFETSTIPKVCGGYTKNCGDVGVSLYSKAVNQVVKVSSTRVAEMTKLLENIQRAVNIGLVNEMKIISDKMGIDIFEVVDAASTKPFGFIPYYPGPGLGGHCIPIDPFYLTWKAKEYGLDTKFIELSGSINRAMPQYVINKLSDALKTTNKNIENSRILVLGIAYKKNVDDVRESPSIEIMQLLQNYGAVIEYSDPHVAKFPKKRDYTFNLSSIKISQKSLETFDAVILATDHDKFDYDLIEKHSSIIVDCRGVYRKSFPGLVKS